MAVETLVGPESLNEGAGGGAGGDGATGANVFFLDHPASEVTIFCDRVDTTPADEWQVELQASLDNVTWTEDVSPVRAWRMPVGQLHLSMTIKGVVYGRIRIINAEGAGGDVLKVDVSWVIKTLDPPA
jgi:hypothetical protein